MSHYANIAQPTVRIPLLPGASVGGPNVRAGEVARVKVSKELARSWRVSLNPIEPAPGTGITDITFGLPNKPHARVTWGFDGVVKQALLDWPMQGGSFSVWGDNVVLELMVPLTWLTTGAAPAFCQSAGYITPGAIRGGMRPTFTVPGGTVSGGGSFSPLVTVPNFARAVRWHQLVNTILANTSVPIAFNGIMDSGAIAVTFTTPADTYTSSERTWPTPDGQTLTPDTNFLIWQCNGPIGESLGLSFEFVLDLG
jgi:hypothetical protein